MKRIKVKKIDKAISRQYHFIGRPPGSSSPEHRTLHKAYVSYRFKHNKISELGRLRLVVSEVPLTTDAPNGNYVKKIGGKIDFSPSDDPTRRIWYADTVENWQSNHGTHKTTSVAVEVLPNYPVNVFFDNSRKGQKCANEFKEYLLENRIITQRTYNNICAQIKDSSFGHDLDLPYKRIHITLAHNADPRKVDFGSYSEIVGQLSEVKRKHFLWGGSTNYLSFVVKESDVRLFKRDLDELIEEKGELGVPVIYSLKRSSLDMIIESNGGIYAIAEREKPLSIPRKVKRDFFDVIKIEGYY